MLEEERLASLIQSVSNHDTKEATAIMISPPAVDSQTSSCGWSPISSESCHTTSSRFAYYVGYNATASGMAQLINLVDPSPVYIIM